MDVKMAPSRKPSSSPNRADIYLSNPKSAKCGNGKKKKNQENDGNVRYTSSITWLPRSEAESY